MKSHEIDYEIYGENMQLVEIELDQGESVLAEAGAMTFMDQSIQMKTIFGDGTDQNKGFMNKLMGAGKRLLTGEGLFMTTFTNEHSPKGKVAFAAPYPGNILAVDLKTLNGQIICQKDAFLCAAKGVSVGIHFQRKFGAGLFGGEGFIMQKLEGDGMVFLHAGGTIIKKQLVPGQVLSIDTGCLVAMSPGIDFDVQMVGDIKSGFFGGEGLFLGRLSGVGEVWIQSLPFSRIADRVISASRGGVGEARRSGRGTSELASLAAMLGD